MLADHVADALREAIAEGEFQPGQQLSEIRMTGRFACSRNTLRESFAMLVPEQLVERYPNRGVFIATPTAEYVRDLYVARAAIEPSAVLHGDFGNARELVALTTSARSAHAAGNHQEVGSINQRFHRAIVRGLGSPTLERTMANLLARMRLSFLLTLPRYPQVHSDHIETNIELAQLIEAGKREQAAELSRQDLTRAMNTIIAALN